MNGMYNRAQDQAGQPAPVPIDEHTHVQTRMILIAAGVVLLLLFGFVQYLTSSESDATKLCKRAWANGGAELNYGRQTQSEFVAQCIEDGQDLYNATHE